MQKVKEITKQFIDKLRDKEFVADKTGSSTIEIINACFVADEPYIIRKPNYDYIKRELEWYESQSLMVQDIPGECPAIWKATASNMGVINSNYGYLAYSQDNWNQYKEVLHELNTSPDSRRANMIYTRPSIWQDYKIDDMSDFICTNNVQYFIRDGKLITSVYMRSNDAVFGYNNDLAWQTHVRDKLLLDLDVVYEPGEIYWNVGSLHVYDRHYKFIENIKLNCITGEYNKPSHDMIHVGTERQKIPVTIYDLKQQEIEAIAIEADETNE